jgi:hypothetical protein
MMIKDMFGVIKFNDDIEFITFEKIVFHRDIREIVGLSLEDIK